VIKTIVFVVVASLLFQWLFLFVTRRLRHKRRLQLKHFVLQFLIALMVVVMFVYLIVIIF
jgi:hypothetical protein